MVGDAFALRREAAVARFLILQVASRDGVVGSRVGSHPDLVPCDLHNPTVALVDMLSGEVGKERYGGSFLS